MTRPVEKADRGAARLLRGRPRLLAAQVTLFAGTISTPAIGWLFSPIPNGFWHDVAFFEPFVLITSAWSFVLYGPWILRTSNPIAAVLVGAVCVVLGIATFVEVSLLLNLVGLWMTSPSFKWPSPRTIFDDAVDGGVVLTIVGSALARFVPELVGAVSGYVIWWSARQRIKM